MKVTLVDSMASDQSVVRAARVSTQGSQSFDSTADAGLINYLMRNGHASPFEHNVFTFMVHAPIVVAREYMRHRIASYNEESGRYRELEPVFYYPPQDRPLVQIGKTSEYKFQTAIDMHTVNVVQEELDYVYNLAWASYRRMLEAGVAKEVARLVLPVGIYTTWYVTINARSLMNFLNLRTAPNAMWEIREVAKQMEEHFKTAMPLTYEAWVTNDRKSI